MKKLYLLTSLLLFGSTVFAQPILQKSDEFTPLGTEVPQPFSRLADTTTPLLRKGCDEIYTEEVQKILDAFSRLLEGRPTKEKLKEYKEFMLTIKLHSDIGFKLRPFEMSITAETRNPLRTPITKYSTCRTRLTTNKGYGMQTVAPPISVIKPCETTYAVQMQEVLNVFKKETKAPSETLKKYKDYMILLKYYEDLSYNIREFEKKTSNIITARLRQPLHIYNTCRDGIIRAIAGGPIFPR